MKFIFLFFALNLICFGALAVLSENLPLFADEQLEYLYENYGVNNNEEFFKFFDEMKQDGLILEVVNRQNVEIIGVIALLNLFTLLTTLHLLVDKLFFKTIDEVPNTRIAVRRSLLISLITFGFLILRLYNLLEWYVVVFVVVLFMFIEFTLYKFNLAKQFTQNELPETPRAE
jgi:hypothetical protein